jgi:hypothetical protein
MTSHSSGHSPSGGQMRRASPSRVRPTLSPVQSGLDYDRDRRLLVSIALA